MSEAGRISRISTQVVRITPKTLWTFLEVETTRGLVGAGEATLVGREGEVESVVEILGKELQGAAATPRTLDAVPTPTALTEAAAFSALDQALADLEAQAQGRPLVDLLGGALRAAVPLYANINRRTLNRSPEGFAASARDALGAGFEAIKVAPFDEVTAETRRDGLGSAMDRGLARVAAVRDAIGSERDLMVDCHWRFDAASAETAIRQAGELGVYWIECPIPETPDNLAVLKTLRGLANGLGLRLAGLEEAVRVEGFEPYLKAGAYDVMMPDVKYVGGYAEMLALSERFEAHGVALSPHNPTGPISHAASLHVSAAMPAFDRLEMQFDESPLFQGLVGGGLPIPKEGMSALPDGGPGLGVRLDAPAVAAHLEKANSWTARAQARAVS